MTLMYYAPKQSEANFRKDSYTPETENNLNVHEKSGPKSKHTK